MGDDFLIGLQPNCIYRLQKTVYLTSGKESTDESSVKAPYDSSGIPLDAVIRTINIV